MIRRLVRAVAPGAACVLALALVGLVLPSMPAAAETARVVSVTEWKAVFGRIETRDRIPARSRLGGTVGSVGVVEGSRVEAGEVIAEVTDEKLVLELGAIDAQIRSLRSQLENAEAELARGESLLERGVTTAQRLDALRTDVRVLEGRIEAAGAERDVLVQRTEEGAVAAPISGTVLDVPVTAGSVVLPGEVVAVIGGGGFFLRLAVPERHADFLSEGAEIRIAEGAAERTGTLARIYPQIENGRVVADVEVEGLPTDFVDARVLVRLPVGRTEALMVPEGAVARRMGLDFVAVSGPDGPVERAVVVGERHEVEGVGMVEILSGLTVGEELASHE